VLTTNFKSTQNKKHEPNAEEMFYSDPNFFSQTVLMGGQRRLGPGKEFATSLTKRNLHGVNNGSVFVCFRLKLHPSLSLFSSKI
jgi:hypothetical protein